jgi:hypothetical protein
VSTKLQGERAPNNEEENLEDVHCPKKIFSTTMQSKSPKTVLVFKANKESMQANYLF